MNKKIIAIILEIIPIASAVISFLLIMSDKFSGSTKTVISVTFILAFLGFAFSIIGKKMAREDKTVRFLGILDWLTTIYVVGFYILAILSFGL